MGCGAPPRLLSFDAAHDADDPYPLVQRWREQSRGWVMHDGWDPSPLFATPPPPPSSSSSSSSSQPKAQWTVIDAEATAAAATTTLQQRLGHKGNALALVGVLTPPTCPAVNPNLPSC
jgi:hypothetical protein